MRARGAKVTDLVVLVVAANEGPMPQTIEALNHARAAKVPIIVAINKIDLPDANIDNVKQKLDSGGFDSGRFRWRCHHRRRFGADQGRHRQATRDDPSASRRHGTEGEPESSGERHRDRIAARFADAVRSRRCSFRKARSIRVMPSCAAFHMVACARCSTIWAASYRSGSFDAGGNFRTLHGSRTRNPIRRRRRGSQGASGRGIPPFKSARRRAAEDQPNFAGDLSQRMREGDVKDLKVIIKGDVQGSVEALGNALERMSNNEVKLQVIHASAGAISETDVTLAAASKGLIIGFNIRPEAKAAQLAEKEGVEDSPLHRHLRSDRRCARGDGRFARADLPREGARPRRSPQDLHRSRRHRSRARWSSTAKLPAPDARDWYAMAA